jgi:hypothetical protein
MFSGCSSFNESVVAGWPLSPATRQPFFANNESSSDDDDDDDDEDHYDDEGHYDDNVDEQVVQLYQ